jgi:hypothetical protein
MIDPRGSRTSAQGKAMIDAAYARPDAEGLVDWGVIYHGLVRVPWHPDMLPIEVVADFALRQLEYVELSSPLLTKIVIVATEAHIDTQTARELVGSLCVAEDVDMERSFRCWRYGDLSVVADAEFIDAIESSGYMDSAMFAWYDASLEPQVPNFERSSPPDYYEHAAYFRRMDRLKAWLRSEREALGS